MSFACGAPKMEPFGADVWTVLHGILLPYFFFSNTFWKYENTTIYRASLRICIRSAISLAARLWVNFTFRYSVWYGIGITFACIIHFCFSQYACHRFFNTYLHLVRDLYATIRSGFELWTTRFSARTLLCF